MLLSIATYQVPPSLNTWYAARRASVASCGRSGPKRSQRRKFANNASASWAYSQRTCPNVSQTPSQYRTTNTHLLALLVRLLCKRQREHDEYAPNWHKKPAETASGSRPTKRRQRLHQSMASRVAPNRGNWGISALTKPSYPTRPGFP